MGYGDTAASLLKEIGGEKNIVSVTHCQTRMRFVLKNESAVKDDAVKAIAGVIGVARKGGQYQVIIGTEVADCYGEFVKLGNFDSGQGTEEKKEKRITPASVVNGIIDAIAGSLAPILPAIIGCGMVRLAVTILNLFQVSPELPTYQILVAIGDAAYYFLPILLAASAAKKFACSQTLAMTFAAILLHPNLTAMFAEGGVTFLTLPVGAATYSSSVIPALLMTWLLSKAEPVLDKYMKGWVKTIFKPALLLLVGAPICLIVVAPIGSFLGDGLALILTTLQAKIGWLLIGLVSAFMPLIVMSGMHYALVPNCITTLGTYGFETILGPTMLASNFSQASASAAVALKSRNKELKAVAFTSAVSAFVAGITEPALYGVTMRLKKPLIASMIGSGAAGLFAGIVGLQNYGMVAPAMISVIQFVSTDVKRNLLYALITILISVTVTFILTLALGWEDPVDEADQMETEDAGVEDSGTDHADMGLVITSPLVGNVVPMDQVNDETFASGMLGAGVAIMPSVGKLFAPFSGTVNSIFDTKHAFGLISDSGIELLIHVGLETVTLKGRGFSPAVTPGQKVKRGELLMEFDLDMLKREGFDPITPVIVANSGGFKSVIPLHENDEVGKDTPVIKVEK